MTTVKFFDSTMTGAPSLSGTPGWGQLTDLLDALLVNGFNLRAPVSITRDGDTATIDFGTAHGHRVDTVIAVAGCDQAAYNGQFRVASITTNTVSFAVTGTPATPATGAAITVKTAPLGFEIAFTGTNKRAYRSPNVQSNRHFLRVDNSLPDGYTTTWAKYARVTVAEGMSDIDTFVGVRMPYDPANPTSNEATSGSGTSGYYGWWKWYHARSASQSDSGGDGGNIARPWSLIGDDRGFYLSVTVAGGQYWDGRTLYGFGDFTSYKPGDAYNTILLAHAAYVTAGGGWIDRASGTHDPMRTSTFNGKGILRDATAVGNYRRFTIFSINPFGANPQYSGQTADFPWPNPADYSLIAHPVYIREETTNTMRGVMPGMLWVHQDRPYLHLTTLENLTGYPGRKFLYWRLNNSDANNNDGGVLFDITGPWR